jgi:hypothetical protein
MSTDIYKTEREIKERFEDAGLAPYFIENSSEIVDLDGEVFAEIVLSDRSRLDEATSLMREILRGQKYSLVVRSKWSIEHIGELAPAYAPSGGLRAAVLIPVALRSGNESITVTVAVTKLAEWEFDSILGGKADLKQVARVVVESALRRGGRSFWDPTTESYLEVASDSVANISRLLKQTA